MAFGVMSVVLRLLLVVALQTLGVPRAIAQGFTFAGMGLNTTAEQLRQRYPTSRMAGNYMHVAPSEARNHIYGIQVPGRSGGGPLKLFFEHSDPSNPRRGPQYPRCNDVVSVLKAKYGSPDATDKFSEERVRNRRLTWKRSGEVLVLHCFRLDGSSFLADALVIDKAAHEGSR